jgi:dephospho-CoA kinase
MFYDVVDDPASHGADELHAAYEAALVEIIDAHGTETVAAESGVDAERLAALAAGEEAELSVEEAMSVLAVDAELDAETMTLELRDRLLMGMTTGVLDVDTLASETGLDISGQEVQQSLEGRRTTTLAELAAIHRVIAVRNDR